MRIAPTAAAALAAALLSGAARAGVAEQDAPPAPAQPASPLEIHPATDATVLLAASAVWALPRLFQGALATGNCAPCDPGAVNRFDRTVIGNRDEAAGIASDVGIVALPALAGLGSLLDARSFGWSAALEDAVIVAEAIAISGAVNQVVKSLALRPRPYMYVAETAAEKGGERESVLSFYSGHTSLAFASAAAFATVFTIRRPQSRWRYAVWAFGLAAASAVGVCRALAGAHFWTDVITGAVVGGGIGALTPALHLRRSGPAREPEARAVAGPGYASFYVRF